MDHFDDHERVLLLELSLQFACVVRRDGTLTRPPAGLAERLGIHELPDSLLVLVAEDDREALAEHIARAPETPASATLTTRCPTSTGQALFVHWTMAARGDSVYLAGRDVSAQRRAERERQALETRLQEKRRMESIGRLAGGVAHDFNNLLTVINTGCHLVSRRIEKATAVTPLPALNAALAGLCEIAAAAERGAGLTRQLMAFSQHREATPDVVDVNQVVHGTRSMLERLIGDRIELSVQTPREPLWARIDIGRLEQVIVNLAVNARDAMVEGGALTVTTEPLGAASPRPGGIAAGPLVRIEVSDTGTGMDADTLQHIFEPFFTTKPAHRGTGLGLATVYSIATQSGGAITVRSEPGHGTTFELLLPAADAPARPRRSEPPQRPSPRAPTDRLGTILLVEDDAAVRASLHIPLRDAGHTVLTAASGPEALALAGTHRRAIDLLISDIVMPGMSGPHLAAELRARQPDLQVLFITGHSRDERGLAGVTPHQVLGKPFAPDELLERVSLLLAETPAPAPRRARPE